MGHLGYVLEASLFFMGICSAQIINFGKCSNPATKTDFDLSQYLGTWYEIQSYFQLKYKKKCVTQILAEDDNGRITVRNRALDIRGKEKAIDGTATVPDSAEPAKLAVSFFGGYFDRPDVDSPSSESNYWVLETDYNEFSAVYSCQSYIFFRVENLWILSKSPSMTDETFSTLEDALEDKGIETSRLKVTDQDDCDYSTVE